MRALTLVVGVALLGCSSRPTPFRDTGSNGDTSTVGDGATLDGTPVGDDPGLGDDGTTVDDVTGGDGSAGDDVINVYDTSSGADACGTDAHACTPRPSGCGAMEVCNNGLDDNCNGSVDENCPCLPGTVQDCFLGPPGSRHVGACSDGTQRCVGAGEFGSWGVCEGGISPSRDTCDNLDNSCNGCPDITCCASQISCPGPGDPRVPDGQPFTAYVLHGAAFYSAAARSWLWNVVGGPCDTLLPRPTFTLSGETTPNLTLTPTLSGDYTVTLTVTAMDGTIYSCTFIVHIVGPGLRVELCWDTSTTVDLDLYLHDPRNTGPWYDSSASPLSSTNLNSCNWSDCEATLRGSNGRSNWGYGNSPLSACQNGPHGADWQTLGHCANPRLDIDNNLSKSIGTPENVNVDAPRDGERFRIMVENYTGTRAHPMVNVYCGGHLRATIGGAPDTVPGFQGNSGATSVGAMWRPADVLVHVNAAGLTTGCDVTPLHPRGATTGFFVTQDDPSY